MSLDRIFTRMNPLVSLILRSPLHVLLSSGLMLLTVTGRPLVGVTLAASELATLVRRVRDVPARTLVPLALRNHLELARQLAGAVRRAWWPIVLAGAIGSRRFRRLALVAVLADVGAAPTDVAYGWGLWRGAVRLRTAEPLLPRRVVWRRGQGPTTTAPAAARASAGDADPPLRSDR